MPDGIDLKRIINLDPETTVTEDDYTIVDSLTGGAKKFALGQALGEIKDGLSSVENNILTDNIRQALLQLASKVAYIDDGGQDYYDDLYNAFYPITPPAELVSISAVYTQSGDVYTTDSLNSLKTDLVVTALYDDQTTATITTYTLSGTLTEGTSVITVTYGGKTTTFAVTVTAILYPMVNASHTFTDGNVISVSNGNHVTLQLNSNITSGTGTSINLYDVTENKDTVYDTTNIGQQSQKFVIPSGASCVFKVRNLNTALTFQGDIKFNLRNTNGTSIGSSSMINCGNAPTEQEYSATWTQSASVAIGLIFLFTNQITGASGSLQFDVELYVNNARWI